MYGIELGRSRETIFQNDKALSPQYDLLFSGGIGFSPSASYLLYPSCYTRNSLVARDRLYLVDTRTWDEEEIMLDPKYNMLAGLPSLHPDSPWYEWKFTKDEKDIYLLAREMLRMNTIAYLLLKLNLETKETEEILKIPKEPRMDVNPWLRISLSQDNKQIFMKGFGSEFRRIQGKKVIVRIVDLNTREIKLQKAFPHNGKGNVAWLYLWLNDETAAVALYEQDEFFFGKIEEVK